MSFDIPLEQVSRADVRVPGEEARLRRRLSAEPPHAGDTLHPRPGDHRRTLQSQLHQNTRKAAAYKAMLTVQGGGASAGEPGLV